MLPVWRGDKGTDMNLHGMSALVTGGASGLGLAAVRRLAAAGASVTAVDLPDADTSALTALGEAVRFTAADVVDEAAVESAVELANGRRDLAVAVNCAGIVSSHKTVSRDAPFPLTDFARTINVNLLGTFNVVRLPSLSG